MWVSKQQFAAQNERLSYMERRIKRLELLLFKEANNRITILGDERSGTYSKDGIQAISTIEETINKF